MGIYTRCAICMFIAVDCGWWVASRRRVHISKHCISVVCFRVIIQQASCPIHTPAAVVRVHSHVLVIIAGIWRAISSLSLSLMFPSPDSRTEYFYYAELRLFFVLFLHCVKLNWKIQYFTCGEVESCHEWNATEWNVVHSLIYILWMKSEWENGKKMKLKIRKIACLPGALFPTQQRLTDVWWMEIRKGEEHVINYQRWNLKNFIFSLLSFTLSFRDSRNAVKSINSFPRIFTAIKTMNGMCGMRVLFI